MELLVRRAMRGEAEAFIELMEQTKPALLRVAYGYFKTDADVADAIGETILNAWEHLGELRKPAYFRTWLTRILINNCNRLLREQRRVQPMDVLPEPAGVWDSTESNLEFKELVESLSEKDRVIFLLYYGEGFTTKEISRTLDIRENTVKSRLKRGREQLRRQLVQTI